MTAMGRFLDRARCGHERLGWMGLAVIGRRPSGARRGHERLGLIAFGDRHRIHGPKALFAQRDRRGKHWAELMAFLVALAPADLEVVADERARLAEDARGNILAVVALDSIGPPYLLGVFASEYAASNAWPNIWLEG